jgi:D-arabinose 1-dehydrogenase-like Zn-dependent alcohol dehydrogenase
MVPGHEIVGIAKEVGPKVSRYTVGSIVGVGCFVDSCRKRGPCLKGLEQYCIEGPVLTYNGIERDGQTRTQGGYSNKIVVDENYVLHIPDNLPMDYAAPLLCAGITMYSRLMHWKAGPGKKVGIIGFGGLGHMGVKIAHALGAEVSVLSHSLRKQDEAKKMGADKFYAATTATTSSSNSQDSFNELKGYFDLIINTLSVEIDWNHYLNLPALGGTMVVVGLPEKEMPLSASSLTNARRSLAGSGIGGSNKISLSHWKGKPIIPMEEWIELRDTSCALNYFPDDFDQVLSYIPKDEVEGEQAREDVKKWDSDYLELMEHTKNSNYGKLKCFHYLLSPAGGDDPIFLGINRLVSKGLAERESNLPQHPCRIVNRFQCPYERTNIKGGDNLGAMNSNFDVEDL